MMSCIWRFVKRHKRKFLFLGFLSAGYAAFRFFRHRGGGGGPEDPQLAAEFLQFARQHHHFEATLQNAGLTSASLLPQVAARVAALADTKALLEQLRQQGANRTALWQVLKVRVITKVLLAVYAACLLTALVHVQLSVLGGYMFLRSASGHSLQGSRAEEEVREAAEAEVLELSEDVKMAYLSSWQHLLETDVRLLCERLEPIAQRVVGGVGLQEVVSLRRLDSLLHEARLSFEKELEECVRVRPTVPAGSELPISEQAVLSRLRRETQELIDCSDFLGVFKACLDSAFSSLLDLFAEHFHRVGKNVTDSGVSTGGASGGGGSSACDRHVNIYDIRIPFAKVIPLVDNVANALLSNEADSQFNRDLFNTDVLKAFSRNIYDTFSRREAR